MGLETVVFNADSSDEIDTAFQMTDRERLDAVFVTFAPSPITSPDTLEPYRRGRTDRSIGQVCDLTIEELMVNLQSLEQARAIVRPRDPHDHL
jgi:hypothetical protein